jgi:hypothetical protein
MIHVLTMIDAKGTVADPRDFMIINAYVEELLKNNRNLKV